MAAFPTPGEPDAACRLASGWIKSKKPQNPVQTKADNEWPPFNQAYGRVEQLTDTSEDNNKPMCLVRPYAAKPPMASRIERPDRMYMRMAMIFPLFVELVVDGVTCRPGWQQLASPWAR